MTFSNRSSGSDRIHIGRPILCQLRVVGRIPGARGKLESFALFVPADIPPENIDGVGRARFVAALIAKATARGVSAEQYALQVLEQDLAPEWLRRSWASAKEAGVDQLSMDEIDAEIAAARQARRQDTLPSV